MISRVAENPRFVLCETKRFFDLNSLIVRCNEGNVDSLRSGKGTRAPIQHANGHLQRVNGIIAIRGLSRETEVLHYPRVVEYSQIVMHSKLNAKIPHDKIPFPVNYQSRLAVE
jgi:hypothetical protein